MPFQAPKIFKRKTRGIAPSPLSVAVLPATKITFLDLPREIRDQIYTDILASPSNAVTLSPWTVEVGRSMTILRTCKQIQRECKEIIWAHNGLRLREPTQLFRRFGELLEIQDVLKIEHIEITLELLDRDELEWMMSTLQAFKDLPKTGSLKSISLIAISDRPRGIEEYREELDLICLGDYVDGRLFGGGPDADGKSLIFKTSWPHFSHWGKRRWLREMLLDRSDTTPLLQELHSMFGGELYIDGVECPDGMIQPLCNLNPRDGEIKIIPR